MSWYHDARGAYRVVRGDGEEGGSPQPGVDKILKLSCFLLFPTPSNICIAFWCIPASACFEYVNSWFTVFTSVTVFIASLQTLFQH